jgi:hypothetical protein
MRKIGPAEYDGEFCKDVNGERRRLQLKPRMIYFQSGRLGRLVAPARAASARSYYRKRWSPAG